MPKIQNGQLSVVLLCCGHGAGGKLAASHQKMARSIAKKGIAILVPDNIGQGERIPMGHAESCIPFACGTCVQGLIIMENPAWINWLDENELFDSKRIGAIGNSGGGTSAACLAALGEKLFALSSSGYPATFNFVAQKEKKHFHCNILPGIVGKLDMWQVYGTFAPKPMFLLTGQRDHLISQEFFFRTARKIKTVYEQLNGEKNFKMEIVDGFHFWARFR